jgi:hypothetical protein
LLKKLDANGMTHDSSGRFQIRIKSKKLSGNIPQGRGSRCISNQDRSNEKAHSTLSVDGADCDA